MNDTVSLNAASTFFDLLHAVQAGERIDVEFKAEVEPWAGYLDAGMRGRIVHARVMPEAVVELVVDLTPYRIHNLAKERADYTSSTGQPGLTATEAGETVNCVTVSVNGPGLLVHSALLAVLPEWSVERYARYLRESTPLSYPLWLESEIWRLETHIETGGSCEA